MRCYFLKPLASIIAVFLLICGLIAPAFAAECTVCDANVRLSDTAGTISANGTTVTATAYGAKKSEQTNTITLTNDSSSDANISFTWSATRSNSLCSYSCNVDGDTNKSGTF